MKWSVLKHYSIDFHFDDMAEEILEINNNTQCRGILAGLIDPGELWTLFHNQNIVNNETKVGKERKEGNS